VEEFADDAKRQAPVVTNRVAAVSRPLTHMSGANAEALQLVIQCGAGLALPVRLLRSAGPCFPGATRDDTGTR